jgi:hypothetical protein
MPKPASYVQPIHFEDFDGARSNGTARGEATSDATSGDFAKLKRNSRNPSVSSASTANS